LTDIVKLVKIITVSGNKREYTLYGANAEICAHIINTHVLEFIMSKDELENSLFLCLGASGGTGYHARLKKSCQFMQFLLEKFLGFKCSHIYTLMSKYEHNNAYYNKYREHVIHQLQVYLTGLFILTSVDYIRAKFVAEFLSIEEAIKAWTITSLTHDWGYIFEWGDITDLSHADESIAVLNAYEEKPIKHFFYSLSTGLLEPQMRKIVSASQPLVELLDSYAMISASNDFKSLFSEIEETSSLCNLGGTDGKPLSSYSEFKKSTKGENRSVFIDHGIASANILLWLSIRNRYWKNHLKTTLQPHTTLNLGLFAEDANNMLGTVVKCACAIALHNIHVNDISEQDRAYTDFGLTLNRFKISLDINPLAFLLLLADVFQEWDRPSFMPDADKDFQAQDMHILSNANEIMLCFPGDVLACLQTGNSRFEKMMQSLDKITIYDKKKVLLTEMKIEDLIKKIRNTSLSFLLNGGVVMKNKNEMEIENQTVSYAYELYKKGRRAANEANWDVAVALHSQAADIFACLNMKDWQSRTLGRVVCSKVYAGKSERVIKDILEKAYNIDNWQGLLNYYWVLDHALKTKSSISFKLFLLRSLIDKWSECGVCDVSDSLKTEGYLALLDALLLFFDQLLEIERNSNWPTWSLSDIPRMDILKAERSITTASSYLKSAAEKYESCDLTSYASWSRCKLALLDCSKTNEIKKILNELTAIMVLGRKILQSPENERNTVKFFLTVVGFYRELLCAILENEFENSSRYNFYLKALEAYDLDEKKYYLNLCKSVLEKLSSILNVEEMLFAIIPAIHQIAEELPWIESSKLKQLVDLFIKGDMYNER